ncbi:MAG: HEAT repeat domain-containing protein [Candidatus Thermoplasmatota archaeon]
MGRGIEVKLKKPLDTKLTIAIVQLEGPFYREKGPKQTDDGRDAFQWLSKSAEHRRLEKARAILDLLDKTREGRPAIVVFPEYSLPLGEESISRLQHLADTRKQIIISADNARDARQNHGVVIVPGEKPCWIRKVAPSEGEALYIERGDPDAPFPYLSWRANSKKYFLAIQVCLDFLNFSKDAFESIGGSGIIVVPMQSTDTKRFIQLATMQVFSWKSSGVVCVFCNGTGTGGLGSSAMVSPGREVHLPAGVESVAIAHVNLDELTLQHPKPFTTPKGLELPSRFEIIDVDGVRLVPFRDDGAEPGESISIKPDWGRASRRRIAEEYQFLDLDWLPWKATPLGDLPLGSLYVDLEASNIIPLTDLAETPEGTDPREAMRNPTSLAAHGSQRLLDLKIAGRLTVVLGEPGSGKSTFLKQLALREASAGRLVLHVDLGQLAAEAPKFAEGDPFTILEKHVLGQLTAIGVDANPHGMRELLSSGECPLLLDSLDEVLETHARRSVSGWISRLWTALGPSAGIVVTSRIASYKETPLRRSADVFTIRPIEPHAIETFVKAWFENLPLDASRQQSPEQAAQELIDLIRGSSALRRLARSPMLLTLVCYLKSQEARVPTQRAQLYSQCVTTLTETLEESHRKMTITLPGNLTPRDVIALLGPIAYGLHESRKQDLSRRDVESQISQALQDPYYGKSRRDADNLSSQLVDEFLRKRAHLLVLHGFDRYGFPHMSFQEYFAGIHIASKVPGEPTQRREFIEREVLPKVYDPHWREPILFLSGLLEAEAAITLIQSIEQQYSSPYEKRLGRDLRVALLALAEPANSDPALEKRVMTRLNEWIEADSEVALDLLKFEAEKYRGTRVARPFAAMLIPKLSSENQRVRTDAVQMIGIVGSRKDIPQVVGLFDDPIDIVRRAAVIAFSKLATRADLALLEPLRERPKRNVRWALAMTYSRLGQFEDLPAVIELLRDHDETIQGFALDAFARIATFGQIAEIRDLLKNGSEALREHATEAYSRIVKRADFDAVVGLLHDPEKPVRTAAVAAFVAIVEPDDLPRAKKMLIENHVWTIEAALGALAKIGSKSQLEDARPFLDHNSKAVRRAALDYFAQHGRTEDLPDILPALRDPDPGVRQRALLVYSAHGTRQNLNEVLGRLEDTSEQVRLTAVDTFTRLVTRDDLGRVQKLLKGKRTSDRWAGVRAFERLATSEDAAMIRTMVQSEFIPVRRLGVTLLGRLATINDVDTIVPFMTGESEHLRWAAAEALGRVAGEEQLVGLSALLTHPQGSIRRATALAMEAILSRLSTRAARNPPRIKSHFARPGYE